RHVSVTATRGVIMDADTVEACLFAADDERGKVKQGPTDGNSDSDADTRHLTTFLICERSSTIQPLLSTRYENDSSDSTLVCLFTWQAAFASRSRMPADICCWKCSVSRHGCIRQRRGYPL